MAVFGSYDFGSGAPPPRDERQLKQFEVEARFTVIAPNVHEAKHIFLHNHGAAIMTSAVF